MRRHLPVFQVQANSQVFVVPRDGTTPRGPKLGPIPRAGMVLRVDDYIFGCLQRGSLVAYEVTELPEPTAEEAAPAQPADEVVQPLASPNEDRIVRSSPAPGVNAPAQPADEALASPTNEDCIVRSSAAPGVNASAQPEKSLAAEEGR